MHNSFLCRNVPNKHFEHRVKAGLQFNPISRPNVGSLQRHVLSAAVAAKALMDNGSSGGSKTGARPPVGRSFLSVRDGGRGICTGKP